MRMHASRKTLSQLLLVIATCCAAACDGGGDSPTAPSGGVATPTPTPAPTPEPVAFGPGQHRVGTDISAGRYFSDPSGFCYWERQSGAGGTLDDILANNIVGDTLQEIVDILPGDFAFEARDGCGDWFSTPRAGMQSGIPPGKWLVGSQVAPGVYQVNAGENCYWERLSSFDGTLDAVLANDFVGDGGPQLVEVRAGDVGFYTDEDCGSWTAASSLDVVPAVRSQSRGDIERNRDFDRSQP